MKISTCAAKIFPLRRHASSVSCRLGQLRCAASGLRSAQLCRENRVRRHASSISCRLGQLRCAASGLRSAQLCRENRVRRHAAYFLDIRFITVSATRMTTAAINGSEPAATVNPRRACAGVVDGILSLLLKTRSIITPTSATPRSAR